MRVLLDECVDRRLAHEISEHDVKTVPEMKWAGMKNGDLLQLAQQHFDIFVTVDHSLAFQQHLPQFDITIVILHAPTNRLSDLQQLIPNLKRLLLEPQKHQVLWVNG